MSAAAAESIFAFINITLYLIIHNLKFTRFAEQNIKKTVNSIFGGIIFLMIIILLRQIIWSSKVITFIDTILIFMIVIVLALLFLRNATSLKKLFFKVYEKKKSILESILLTALIISGFISEPFWFVSLVVMAIFLVKEAFLMSDSMKKMFDDK